MILQLRVLQLGVREFLLEHVDPRLIFHIKKLLNIQIVVVELEDHGYRSLSDP